MFGLKGRDFFNKSKSNTDELLAKVHKRWHTIAPYVLGILVIGSIGIVVNIWYKYLYQRDVSEAEINQYIITQNRDFVFDKEQFDVLQNIIKIRQEKYNAEKVEYSDPFYRNSTILKEDVEIQL